MEMTEDIIRDLLMLRSANTEAFDRVAIHIDSHGKSLGMASLTITENNQCRMMQGQALGVLRMAKWFKDIETHRDRIMGKGR